MNYLKIYYNLIETRRNLNRDCYLEIHHIVPKGVYGKGIMDESSLTDVEDENNKIHLTGREHFVAHRLLYKAFPKVKALAAGFFAMANLSNKHHRRFTPSSRAVEEARMAYALSASLPVAAYRLTGELYKVFKTTEEAAKYAGTHKATISASCNTENGVNNVAGYLWRRFEKEPLKRVAPFVSENTLNSKKIHQYNYKGEYIRSFKSKREAEREVGMDREDGDLIYSRGFWFLQSDKKPEMKNKIKYQPSQKRKVDQIDKKTGELIKTWSTGREATRVLGIYSISAACKGKRKTAGGFIWRYSDEDYKINLDKHKKGYGYKIRIWKDEIFIGEYVSLREAERNTGVNRSFLSRCISNGATIDGYKVEKKSNLAS
jgi:hypothetical protein